MGAKTTLERYRESYKEIEFVLTVFSQGHGLKSGWVPSCRLQAYEQYLFRVWVIKTNRARKLLNLEPLPRRSTNSYHGRLLFVKSVLDTGLDNPPPWLGIL
jgi:hypothetical protein